MRERPQCFERPLCDLRSAIQFGIQKEPTMVEISISFEPNLGASWDQWKRLVPFVEERGFAGLYVSDHIVMPEPPDYEAVDAWLLLTHLADHSRRLRIGTMVSPLSMRL